MITEPNPGHKVTLLFKNGMVEEGIVLSWTDTKAVLRAIAGQNILILQNVSQDVIAVKVHLDQVEKPIEKPNKKVSSQKTQVAVDRELIPDKYYTDERLRAKSLAELHQLKAQEERLRARELLTSFEPNGLKQNAYDPERPTIPRKLQSVPFDTQKETVRNHKRSS